MSHQAEIEANRVLWNARVPFHLQSRTYDQDGFLAGRNSLTEIERELLGEVRGRKALHLQCHFGQDTLSLARLGAEVTGLDFSETALEAARNLASRCGLKAEWVLSDVTVHRPELDGRFDIVLTSYGTIGWLPELGPWASNIARYLKPGGRFVFVEFHPVVWMFDNAFTHVQYSYFNRETIREEEQGTYADRAASIKLPSYGWNHSLGEVLGALLAEDLRIERFTELDGSPYDCFADMVAGDDGLHRIKGLEGKLPMVYGLRASKRNALRRGIGAAGIGGKADVPS